MVQRCFRLSTVGEIVLRLSTRTGYSQIWPHKIQLGQNWLQAPLQEGVEDQSTTVDCGSTAAMYNADDGSGGDRAADAGS